MKFLEFKKKEEKRNRMSSWMDMLVNPKNNHIKKAMFQVLKERYAENENIIERIGASLITDGDSKAFFKLVADLYEMGYLKSVNDHREQLVKLGFIATVVPENKSNIE